MPLRNRHTGGRIIGTEQARDAAAAAAREWLDSVANSEHVTEKTHELVQRMLWYVLQSVAPALQRPYIEMLDRIVPDTDEGASSSDGFGQVCFWCGDSADYKYGRHVWHHARDCAWVDARAMLDAVRDLEVTASA